MNELRPKNRECLMVKKLSFHRQVFVFFTAAIFILLATIVFSPQSQAQISSDPAPRRLGNLVQAVYFPGGRFERESNGGGWNEYRSDGTFRYRFRQVGLTHDTISLRNDRLQVDLAINTIRKEVFGEWPGHPRAMLYRITRVEHFGGPILPPSPGPNPIPPGPRHVAPVNLTYVAYSGLGGIEKTTSGQWREFSPGGSIFSYKTLGYNARSLFLFDNSRNAFIEIDTLDRKVRIAEGGAMRDYFNIQGFSRRVAPNPVPTRPGSDRDAHGCIGSAGYIWSERSQQCIRIWE